jgi:hypothetical protein
LVETKSIGLYDDLDYDFELENERKIIGAKPSVTIATKKVQQEESKEPEEVEHIFHSEM